VSSSLTSVNQIGHGHCDDHDEDVIVLFSSGSSNVYVDNVQSGLTSHLVGQASCGHLAFADIGSGTVFINGQAAHRISDGGVLSGGGTYTTVTGSSSVNIGD
jgi:hypothetical protein